MNLQINRKMKSKFILFILLCILIFTTQCKPYNISRYQAKRIALDTIKKIKTEYDLSITTRKKAYQVIQGDTVWIVRNHIVKSRRGGGFSVIIRKKDGTIIEAIGYK